MPVLTEPPSMGDVLKYEVNPNYTREVITLLIGTNYPSGAVLGRITASGKYTLSAATGADGAQVAAAVLLYPVNATLADAVGIVLVRGPSIVSRAGLAYEGRSVSDTMMVDVRVSDLPDPRPGDLIVIGADSFTIQGEPVRDREHLIWTLDLRPS